LTFNCLEMFPSSFHFVVEFDFREDRKWPGSEPVNKEKIFTEKRKKKRVNRKWAFVFFRFSLFASFVFLSLKKMEREKIQFK